MAYQGEYFVERYGAGRPKRRRRSPGCWSKGVKVSAGTDATRVASYNPWVSLAWLVTGKTVGGLRIYPQRNCLDRETALRMWTENVTWFSNEEGKKGRIEAGQLADLIVPDRDYFACAEDEIADITSDLTIVGGKVVYGAGDFARLDAGAPPPAMPTGRRCAASAATRPGAIRKGAGHDALPQGGAELRLRQPAARSMAMITRTAWSARLPICRPANRSGARSAAPAGRCDMSAGAVACQRNLETCA